MNMGAGGAEPPPDGAADVVASPDRGICVPAGQSCSANAGCCAPANCEKGICTDAQPIGEGDPCLAGTRCGDGTCVQGVCARACALPGAACHGSGRPCCAGDCGPDGAIIPHCGPKIGCYPTFAPCQQGSDCCSELCQGGLCRLAVCQPAGGKCAGNGDCCQGFCARGHLGPEICVDCIPAGYKCTASSQCCDGMCENGKCARISGQCGSLNGAFCNNNNDQCCSKVCQPSATGTYCVAP
jgi:hypothetical protein